MLVLVNSGSNVHSTTDEVRQIESEVESALGRFEHGLTRIEVHLSDEAAGRESGDDIRCLLEARPAGLDPVAVTHHATTVMEAVGGATDKLESLLTSTLGRRADKQGRDTIRG